jgi:8-hydroxy-5-deazaflavin:NADPH oxidoreductase
MEIGVIGAGNVGGTLGRRWAQAGHTVLFVV